MKIRIIIVTIALLLVGAIALVFFLFADKRTMVVKFTDSHLNEVRILGESNDRFEDWSFSLYWRKAGGPWMGYLLDRQVGFWNGAELSESNNLIIVKRNRASIGLLNTIDGSFQNDIHHRTEHQPQVILASDDPFNRTNRIYPESPDWNSVWPAALQPNQPKLRNH